MGGLASDKRALQVLIQIRVSSMLSNTTCNITLFCGKPLKLYYTKFGYASVQMAEMNNSGMVKENIDTMGNPQWSFLKQKPTQRLNGCGLVGHVSPTGLRYSPSFDRNIKITRQQLSYSTCLLQPDLCSHNLFLINSNQMSVSLYILALPLGKASFAPLRIKNDT